MTITPGRKKSDQREKTDRLLDMRWGVNKHEIEVVAYHEAGHAVMAIELGIAIDHVAVTSPSHGNVKINRSHDTYRRRVSHLLANEQPLQQIKHLLDGVYLLLAGPAAEYEFRKLPHSGPGTIYFVDHDMVNEIIAQEAVRDLFDRYVWRGLAGLQAEVENWVADPRVWDRIELLAGALMQHRHLEWQSVQDQLLLAKQPSQLRLF